MTQPVPVSPEISVVIPTFNRREAVTAAIRSVLDQRYKGPEIVPEIVIVDDGSSDGTEARLKELFSDRIRFFRSAGNRGGGWARNHGITQARGRLVCFLDSDDVYLPSKIQFVTNFFAQHPDADVLVDSHQTADPEDPSRPVKAKINPEITDPATFRRPSFFPDRAEVDPRHYGQARGAAAGQYVR